MSLIEFIKKIKEKAKKKGCSFSYSFLIKKFRDFYDLYSQEIITREEMWELTLEELKSLIKWCLKQEKKKKKQEDV